MRAHRRVLRQRALRIGRCGTRTTLRALARDAQLTLGGARDARCIPASPARWVPVRCRRTGVSTGTTATRDSVSTRVNAGRVARGDSISSSRQGCAQSHRRH